MVLIVLIFIFSVCRNHSFVWIFFHQVEKKNVWIWWKKFKKKAAQGHTALLDKHRVAYWEQPLSFCSVRHLMSDIWKFSVVREDECKQCCQRLGLTPSCHRGQSPGPSRVEPDHQFCWNWLINTAQHSAATQDTSLISSICRYWLLMV